MVTPSVRIREIDLLRALAIVLMTLFHAIFDAAEFYDANISYTSGIWYYTGKLSAILFLLTSGISVTLGSHSLKRGLTVLAAGLLVIAATYWFSPASFVIFGILQLIGTSMLTYPLLRRLSCRLLALLAIAAWLAGLSLQGVTTGSLYLLPFGVTPPFFASLDYYPLLPWYGFFVAGVLLGKVCYPARQPLFPHLPDQRLLTGLEWLGRHSLLTYLIHQPVLLLLFAVFMPLL